ncbi:MAG TPA: MFS transporter [Leifsonia sp.]|nr:MFS transporter [Leifsonia sp.]
MKSSTGKGGAALVALATAQFLMVIDQTVMNVSINQLVHDFHTTVTTIQAVITLYCLVMAMLILTGAKIGDMIGRRRAFIIGLIIYACGSALTAVSQSVAVLALGWSVLEGIGAALVFPALAALIAGNFQRASRKAAYAVIGGVAGAGIAVGPIVGGWATTVLTWRIVFIGEVFVAAFILIMMRYVKDAPAPSPKPKLDVVGAMLSATGLGVFVFGVLKSSEWGWVEPKNSPFTIFGFSITLFVISAGCFLLWGFVTWQRHREATNRDPLIHLSLTKIPPVRAGVIGLFSQNLILMGTFFVVPLYLQLVLGLNAFETGIRMLPISITMLVTAALGAKLSNRFTVRTIVRSGLFVTIAGVLILLSTIQPTLSSFGFALGMGVLGIGMGLMISQLGNVIQSSVQESGRSEAGGLQFTGQQLGSALGVAFIGAIVLTGLTSTFISTVAHDPRISEQVSSQVGVAAGSNTNFASATQVEAAAKGAGLDEATTTAIVSDYEDAQLRALKAGLLGAALLAGLSLLFTRELPHEQLRARKKASAATPPP